MDSNIRALYNGNNTMKTKLILIGVIAILTLSLLVTFKSCQTQKERAERQETNVYALTERLEVAKFRDSLNLASIRSMEFKQSEFERAFKEKDDLIKELKIKKPTQYIEVETKTTDTIWMDVVQKDSLQSFAYKDKWLSLQGEIRRGRAKIDYQSRDSLVLVAHRIPKRFLGFLWYTKKTKMNRVEVVSFNPKTKITGITSIKIE